MKKLFTIFQKDENLIKSKMSAENNQIEKLVHDFKDNFIVGVSELVNVFLLVGVFLMVFFKYTFPYYKH